MAYGARLVLTPGVQGMPGAIAEAERICAEEKGFMPQQFENSANWKIHERTTGPEIIEALQGRVDAFVAGVGTGGTLTGVGRALRSHNPDVLLVALEPSASPILSGGSPAPHKIQGIGAGFIPSILDQRIYNRVMTVDNDAAIEMARTLVREEGIFAGISSGANVYAAVEIAKTLPPEANLVTIICDTGERYLSTGIFDD